MKIPMLELEGSEVFGGTGRGRIAYGKIVSMIQQEPAGPEPLFFDFGGVEMVTSSYLRECVLGIRNFTRAHRSNHYPVVANLPPLVREELVEYLRMTRDALISCDLSTSGTVSNVTVLGEIDPSNLRAFDLVAASKQTDAGELSRREAEREKIQQSAWNKRLAALAKLGLVVELSHGRNRKYQPLFGGG